MRGAVQRLFRPRGALGRALARLRRPPAKATLWACLSGSAPPWCEAPGAKCAKVPEFAPRPYQPQRDGAKLMCGCKEAQASFCNGSCVLLYADLNPYIARAAGFGGRFVSGVFYTWTWGWCFGGCFVRARGIGGVACRSWGQCVYDPPQRPIAQLVAESAQTLGGSADPAGGSAEPLF